MKLSIHLYAAGHHFRNATYRTTENWLQALAFAWNQLIRTLPRRKVLKSEDPQFGMD